MVFRLSKSSIEAAIRHLCRYGDTDVFPHLPELAFYADEQSAIIAEIVRLDLDNYAPAGAIEALAPKSRFGFRLVHQLPALDALLLLACVVEIGEKIEGKRHRLDSFRAFSYRFKVDTESGRIFRADRTYKDWLHKQQKILSKNSDITKIVSTDISDFYARINFHRLENLLDEAAPRHGAARFIKKHIKAVRAKQSYGLPVGGAAARLLAELAMVDTDRSLKDRGILATRFVDDFRIFLKNRESPYDVLGYLAEQLGINEGLSLNVSKTLIKNRSEYVNGLDSLTTDINEIAKVVALDALTSSLYFDGDLDEEDLERLRGLNLVGFLEEGINAENWDIGHIKVIFRALKLAKPKGAICFIIQHFSSMTVFAKDLCLLMETLEAENRGCFDELRDEIIDAILKPPASSIQWIRTWLLEIFVRGIVGIDIGKLNKFEILTEEIDRRQLLLIRGRSKDKNYFRKKKTAISSFTDQELLRLIWGASCLPRDEYKNWISTITSQFNKPLGGLFLTWAVKNQDNLVSKLKAKTVDHSD